MLKLVDGILTKLDGTREKKKIVIDVYSPENKIGFSVMGYGEVQMNLKRIADIISEELFENMERMEYE